MEQLTYYRMLPEMGPPESNRWEFPGSDPSWRLELEEFFEDIRRGRRPSANLEDARATLSAVETIYAKSGYDFR